MAAIAAAACAALTTATPVAAHRAPTPGELAEMAGATGPPTDPACVTGRISTVDIRWGALVAADGPGCPKIERTWVLRRERPGTPGGRWHELRQGLRFGVCSHDLPGIPNAAGVDLGVCAPPSRRVYAPSGERLAFKPARLRYSRNATIDGLRWTRWGEATAAGRGTFAYRDRFGGFRVAVIVRLSEMDLCGSDRTYLGAQLTAARPQDAAAVRAYSGRWFRQCPGVTGN